MGVISTFLDVITSFNGFSYVENAKEWGDNIWDNMDGVSNGVLSLTKIDERLYKQLRLEFRNGTIGVFTESNDRGWAALLVVGICGYAIYDNMVIRRNCGMA